MDIQIVQASSGRSYTWSNYGFGQFSDWTSKFLTGEGTINVLDSASGKLLLSIPGAPLTPGPLVVAIKCPDAPSPFSGTCWPPSDKQLGGSVETIAASFVPPTQGSGVRLFNLSPDTPLASLDVAQSVLAADIAYGLGSTWVSLASTPTAFDVTDSAGKTIASSTATPPAAPDVFTLWLIGNSTAAYASEGGGPFEARLVPQADAPHDASGLLLCPGPK